MDRGILIAETRHGFVCANAGVDASNVEPGYVTVLPAIPMRQPSGCAKRSAMPSVARWRDRVRYLRARVA